MSAVLSSSSSPARLPADLIEEISEGRNKSVFTFTKDGAPVYHGKTYEEHSEDWDAVDDLASGAQWALAAIAASLEVKHGEATIATFASDKGRSSRYIQGLAKTYRAFVEKSRRLPKLSFWHHYTAAEAQNPAKALNFAHDKNWSTRELERWIKLEKSKPRQHTVTVIEPATKQRDAEIEEWEEESLSSEEEAEIRSGIEEGLRGLAQVKGRITSHYVLRLVNGWIEELEWELIQVTDAPSKISDRVRSLIRSGCYVREEITRRAKLEPHQTDRALSYLAERGEIEKRKQGGKTEVARGERTVLWMPVDAPVGSDFQMPGYRPIVEYGDEEDT